MNKKVVIIGCGNVGMSYAYALLNQKTYANELVLIDLDVERIKGEVMDLNHCLAYSPSKLKIKVGTYDDCKDAALIVIAAGVNQGPHDSRLDLLNNNSKIFRSIIKSVKESGFNGIFLIATNPVDIMTYIAWKHSGFPHNKVIGSGTSLDTARLRYIIGDKLEINSENVHGYVIGEHGDSEFIPWSNVMVGMQKIDDFLSKKEMQDIGIEVKDAAKEIIAKKGATYYGIGMCLVKITNAILGDENSVLVVSNYDENNDVFIGLPAVVNASGIEEKIYFNLNKDEEDKLQHSIDIIKEAQSGVDFSE